MNANLRTSDSPRTSTSASRTAAPVKSGEGVKVDKAITVNCPASEAYSFWRRLQNLPLFMRHLVSVTPKTETESHWVAQTPTGNLVEWDAKIIEEKQDELIVWKSTPGSELESAGSVRFAAAPGNRGTLVKVSLKYSRAGGKIAKLFAKHFNRDAKKEVAQNLFHFKSLLETGEIPTIDGQPKGNERLNPES